MTERSAREVFEDHLRKGQSGSIEADLERNYAENVVILCTRGVFRGHDGVRQAQRFLSDEALGARFSYRTKLVQGEVAFWSGRASRMR